MCCMTFPSHQRVVICDVICTCKTMCQLISFCAVGATREDSHALYLNLQDDDIVKSVPIKRGDITVHDERVAHGSGPNMSSGWRKAYVLALRKAECIAEERSLGFTHSHNDENSWDVFNQHSK